MSTATTERPILDVKSAARQLGVSIAMVYKLIRLRKIEGYAVGRRKLIYADSLADYRRRTALTVATPEPLPNLTTPKGRRREPAAATPLVLPERRHLR